GGPAQGPARAGEPRPSRRRGDDAIRAPAPAPTRSPAGARDALRAPRPATSLAIPAATGAVHLAAGIALGNRVALVVRLAPARDTDQELRPPAREVELERD